MIDLHNEQEYERLHGTDGLDGLKKDFHCGAARRRAAAAVLEAIHSHLSCLSDRRFAVVQGDFKQMTTTATSKLQPGTRRRSSRNRFRTNATTLLPF